MPAFGGDTIEPALALPDRREQVDDPPGELGGLLEQLEPEPLVREQRREVLEARTALAGVVRTRRR